MSRPVAVIVAATVCAAVVLAAWNPGARASADAARFRNPPANATVYARQFGNDALALAVIPRPDNTVRVEATVVGRQGTASPASG